MPTTEHIHLPLYTDEETPDLSTTGHYNHAMEILDAKLAAETKARTDADTALGSRIDNAETEISANSADLTGIKGLTYGEGRQVFLENENGSYSSPALVEIRHEISNLQSQGEGTGLTVINAPDDAPPNAADLYAKIQAAWPNCVITSGPEMFLPALAQTDAYYFNGAPDYRYRTLHRYAVSPSLAGKLDGLYATPDTTWGEIETAQ